MPGFMLDTNICIYVLKNHPPHLKQAFNRHAEALCISSITLAELCYGAAKSARVAENTQAVEAFVARLDVLAFSPAAAAHYGDIRAHAERAGKPIGPHDMLIGAHARSEGLILVTNNLREFKRIDGLRVENWT